jgi:hypothetical protein
MKEEKTMSEKIDLINAVILVAEFWEVEPKELIGFTALIKKEKQKEWNEIAKEVSEFSKMDIKGRAKSLGLDYSETSNQ